MFTIHFGGFPPIFGNIHMHMFQIPNPHSIPWQLMAAVEKVPVGQSTEVARSSRRRPVVWTEDLGFSTAERGVKPLLMRYTPEN